MQRWLTRWLCVLVLAVAPALPATGQPASMPTPDAPLKEIVRAGEAFVRAAALPTWAELLEIPPAPPQNRPAPVVVRLWETQLLVAASPVQLTNWAVQVHHASALSEIGQLALEFNPQFERLLLHKVSILRGRQMIDHTRTAPVRLLQRESQLESGVYSGMVTVSIVLPRVRVGDTLHLVYSIVGEDPAIVERYSQRALWDQTQAIAWRRVTLVVPAERHVRWRWVGGAGGDGPSPTETVIDGVRRLRFEARDLAAAVVEPSLPPRVLATRRLDFSEYADWNEVARWAQALFPAHAALPLEMAPLMARLRAVPDPQERTAQALQWVQTEIRNWSVALAGHTVRPQLPAVVISRGYGDCKDKSLLLSTMLRELEVDARPALASLATRSGPAAMLPSPDAFDHTIVEAKLAGREFYLDPTIPTQFGMLSRLGQRLEEAAVLPIDAETKALVIVRSPNRDEIFHNRLHERLSLENVSADGRLDVEMSWSGNNAESLRLLLAHMDVVALRRFVGAGYWQQYAGSRLLGDPEVNDDRRLNQLTIRASLAVPELARAIGGQWAISFAPNLGDAIDMPHQTVRRFPLALPCFPITYSYRIDMTWPDGISIDEGLASRPWETPHFQLLTTRNVRGSTETRTIQFTTKVSEVAAEDVASFAANLIVLEARIGGVMTAWGSGAPSAAGMPGDERP
jgi:transglutaminase-like putative cysteine protease